MKTAFRIMMLVPLLLVTASYHDCDWKEGKTLPPICEGRFCDRVVHINEDCDPVDAAGASLVELDVLVGTRVCFRNDSKCVVVLKFDTDLFFRASVRLTPGACANRTVLSTARGNTYGYEIVCICDGVSGHGHGNPDIRVGEDDEDDTDG